MSSSHIPVFLRKLVIRRAGNRCEYCRLSQKGQEATFHIDHIVPMAADGRTVAENLALACVSCLLRKERKKLASILKLALMSRYLIRDATTGQNISNGAM